MKKTPLGSGSRVQGCLGSRDKGATTRDHRITATGESLMDSKVVDRHHASVLRKPP